MWTSALQFTPVTPLLPLDRRHATLNHHTLRRHYAGVVWFSVKNQSRHSDRLHEVIVWSLCKKALCVCGCCTVNTKPCPEHMKADQRLSWSMLLIECTGQCASLGRTEACLQMSAFLSSPWIKDSASLPCVLVGGCYVCVSARERQRKPVWSDKLEFNWLWWGYRGHIRRRTDKKQRWFPFFLSSFTVFTERSAETGVALVTLNHRNSLFKLRILQIWVIKVQNQVYPQPQSP